MRTSRIFLDPRTLAIEQTGFRWGADDGSESAHTFLQDQNVDISQAGSTPAIVRFLIATIGNQAAAQLKLQVKRSTGPESEWRDVPVA